MATSTLERIALPSPRATISPSLVEDAQRIATPVDLVEWSDMVYREARGDERAVPWSHRRANPALVAWLNAEAPSLIRPGARVAVVGCGLGRDVAELVGRGYDALGFDCSPCAIDWARSEHPSESSRFMVASLCDLPARLRRRFDLVVEVHTLQSAPPSMRGALAAGMVELMHRSSLLIAVARGRDDSVALEDVPGPPYPLTGAELEALLRRERLAPLRPNDDFFDDHTPPTRRLRGVFGGQAS